MRSYKRGRPKRAEEERKPLRSQRLEEEKSQEAEPKMSKARGVRSP